MSSNFPQRYTWAGHLASTLETNRSSNGKGLSARKAYTAKDKSVMQLKTGGKTINGLYKDELAAIMAR